MNTRSSARKMNLTKIVDHLLKRFLPILGERVQTRMLPQLNNPGRARGYIPGIKTQDQPISKNFENAGRRALERCLNELGISSEYQEDAYLEVQSDTSIETPWCIIQLDQKVCQLYDPDYTKQMIGTREGLVVHLGVAQTSLQSTEFYERKKNKTIPYPRIENDTAEVPGFYGRQKEIIDGKPVITLITFLKWDYKDKWIATSIGLAVIPHSTEDVIFLSRKSVDETRLFITNPSLYTIVPLVEGDELADLVKHSNERKKEEDDRKKAIKKTQPLPAASESPSQIPDSVQSADTSESLPVPDTPHP